MSKESERQQEERQEEGDRYQHCSTAHPWQAAPRQQAMAFPAGWVEMFRWSWRKVMDFQKQSFDKQWVTAFG